MSNMLDCNGGQKWRDIMVGCMMDWQKRIQQFSEVIVPKAWMKIDIRSFETGRAGLFDANRSCLST